MKHSCAPDPDSLLEHLAKQKYKLMACDLNYSTNEAYKLVLEELQLNHPGIVRRFVSFQSLSSMGHRSNIKHTPRIHKSPADQEIAGEYSKTADGKQFLLYYGVKGDPPNHGEHDKRLVIAMFSTREAFTTCVKSKHVCFDGTFKVCPRPFHQLYTIHAYVGDNCLPLIYVLLS